MVRADNSAVKTIEEQIYEILEARNDWTHLRDIGFVIAPFAADSPDFHSTSARRVITKAIANINSSDKYEKFIIHGDKGVKLATEEEASRYIDARFKESLKQLKQTHKLAAKAGLNNQTQIIGNVISAFA